MEFSKLIDSISKENKDFYVIKEAIDFANDEWLCLFTFLKYFIKSSAIECLII